MNCIAVACILTFVIFASVQAFDMKLLQSCKQKTNCKEDLVQKVTARAVPETEECYCAVACIAKERQLVTDSGLDEDKFRALMKKIHLSKDKVDTILQNYKTSNPANECEAARSIITNIKSVIA